MFRKWVVIAKLFQKENNDINIFFEEK